MKKFMKKGLILTLILVCIASIFALSACGYKAHNGEKTITLIIGEDANQEVFKNYKTDSEYLYGVLKEFDEEDYFTIKTSGEGSMIYINQLGDLKPDSSKNEFITILTSIEDYQDTTDYAISRKYDDTTVISANLGCASLPIQNGATYMLFLTTY